jgi:hypothetical protein
MALLRANTGIGTTNPTSALQVVGDGNFSGIVTARGGFNIGIQSGGINVTTGVVTALNFVGSGNTFYYNSATKIVDISISTSATGFDWNSDTDLGLITDSVTTSSDNGSIETIYTSAYDLGLIATIGLVYPTQFVLPSFTVSTLPSANPAGQMLFVTDETGGSIPAFSDGTNWRRVTDRAIVS